MKLDYHKNPYPPPLCISSVSDATAATDAHLGYLLSQHRLSASELLHLVDQALDLLCIFNVGLPSESLEPRPRSPHLVCDSLLCMARSAKSISR